MQAISRRIRSASVLRCEAGAVLARSDALCVEAPLRIFVRLGEESEPEPLTITMRTPGTSSTSPDEDDVDLALGFLLSEGLLHAAADVLSVGSLKRENSIVVTLRDDAEFERVRFVRHFLSTSACGVCGKTSLEALAPEPREPLRTQETQVFLRTLHRLPTTLRKAQPTFSTTGGLHAAALFDGTGNLLAVREDVGRHNALDKLIGSRFRLGEIALHERVLLVSGRASFELLQKARMACIAVFASIGAPSSLALDLARRDGMTLCGFLRDGSVNVYCGAERLCSDDGKPLTPEN